MSTLSQVEGVTDPRSPRPTLPPFSAFKSVPLTYLSAPTDIGNWLLRKTSSEPVACLHSETSNQRRAD